MHASSHVNTLCRTMRACANATVFLYSKHLALLYMHTVRTFAVVQNDVCMCELRVIITALLLLLHVLLTLAVVA
jgi:hypothetical protein